MAQDVFEMARMDCLNCRMKYPLRSKHISDISALWTHQQSYPLSKSDPGFDAMALEGFD